MTTILLLTLSNIFMTFAWYGHLKYRHAPLFKIVVISWLIAFAEYCFQVPANRIGSYEFATAQLKTIQEVITLTVFSIFSVLYLREPLQWNYLEGFAMMIGGSPSPSFSRNGEAVGPKCTCRTIICMRRDPNAPPVAPQRLADLPGRCQRLAETALTRT
ncbi:MAG TPA: DMT family protein [Terriglobales bacterium]